MAENEETSSEKESSSKEKGDDTTDKTATDITSTTSPTATILEGFFFTPSSKITTEVASMDDTLMWTARSESSSSETADSREGSKKMGLNVLFSSITYKSLLYMPTISFEKYMITPRHRLRKMLEQDYKTEVWTEVPILPAVLITSIRNEHDAELSSEPSFLLHLKKEFIHDVQLNALFNTAYSHATNLEILSIFCSNLSACELFSLLMIFLHKLETPVLRLNEECVELLLKHAADIPESYEKRQTNLNEMYKFCVECDVKVQHWDARFDEILQSLYKKEVIKSRNEEFETSNALQEAIRKSLFDIGIPQRKNLARFVVRNLMLELTRSVYRQLKKARYGATKGENNIEVVFKKIKEKTITKVAYVMGPLLLDLPSDSSNAETLFQVAYYVTDNVHAALEAFDVPGLLYLIGASIWCLFSTYSRDSSVIHFHLTRRMT